MGREIYDIINDMAEVLNASQMQKLQELKSPMKRIHKVKTAVIVKDTIPDEQIDTTLRYAMVNQNNVKLSHRKYIS